MLLLGCSPQGPPRNATPAAAVVSAPEDSPTPASSSDTFSETLPRIHGPAGYLGSAACRDCHRDQYASWHRSYHRSMTQVVSEESVQADFQDVNLETDTTRFTLSKRAGEFWVHMEPLVARRAEGSASPSLDQRLGLVTGSHHMQVFWVPEGQGNVQLGFPFTWLIPERRWVPRNATFIRPPDMAHHAELWNVVCSRCHTTAVEPHFDSSARTAHTEVAELGISCEACHGPGQRHVEARKASVHSTGTLPLGEILHPKKIPAERSAQVCGFCHSMKWIDKSNDWRDHGFQFRPGDDLDQTTPIIRPSRVDSIPGLKEYLARNPDVLRDFFWSDGMIRVSGREFNGLIESPCYRGGKFSCVSCHSLHEGEPAAQLAEKAKGNGACLQCHTTFREPAALAAHTHHRNASAGSECYNCHMPYTSYGILKSIRSHQISSPNIAADLASGRPNACNLCHIDQTLTWTSSHLQNWYQQPKSEIPGDLAATPHLVNLALTGDAGQRALAAWHLSWPPALSASSTNFIPLILAQLLDDPYAAVRCVAERSAHATGAALSEGYDFTVDPRSRGPVREQLWNAWEHTPSKLRNTNESILLTPDGQIDRTRFETLLQQRNERPVRLRE